MNMMKCFFHLTGKKEHHTAKAVKDFIKKANFIYSLQIFKANPVQNSDDLTFLSQRPISQQKFTIILLNLHKCKSTITNTSKHEKPGRSQIIRAHFKDMPTFLSQTLKILISPFSNLFRCPVFLSTITHLVPPSLHP